MAFPRFFQFATFASLLILAPVTLPADIIPMDGRIVLEPTLSTDTLTPDYVFEIEREVDTVDVLFALLVPGYESPDGLRFELNGVDVDFAPVVVTEGILYRLPFWALQNGKNVLTATSLPGAAPESLRLFSLLGTTEEVHFDASFRSSKNKAQPAQHPSQANFDALHYDLDLITDITSRDIVGTLTMEARSLVNGLNQVALDFALNSGNMSITSVVDPDTLAPLTYFTQVHPTNTEGSHWIVITLPTTANIDDVFKVRVSYQGTPRTGGAFGSGYVRSTYSGGNPIIYTFSEPYKARTWWPCKDLPDDKATINLSITAAKPYLAVSNGKLVSTVDNGTTQTFRWEEGYPIPTYLVSLGVSNYVSTTRIYTGLDGTASMPITHYVLPPDAAFDFQGLDGTHEAMLYFTSVFGEYPFLDEKYATVTHLSSSGMEHNTITGMPRNDVGINGGRGRRNVHELAHHWFGNLVTCESFDHLWLNEGWATYCEALFFEHIGGEDGLRNTLQGWLATGISDTFPLVYPNADSFSGSVVYRRGGYVLHMLRYVMGDDAFFDGARKYLNDNAFGTVVTEDLQAAMEHYHGESLQWFFDQWAYRAGRPDYRMNWSVSGTAPNKTLNINLQQLQSGGVFQMPVTFLLSDIDGNTQEVSAFNNQLNQTFNFPIGSFPVFEISFDPKRDILRTNLPSTSTPTFRTAVGGVTPTMTWQAVSGASGYQVLASENGTNWTILNNGSPVAGTSLALSELDVDRTYMLRVRALSGASIPSEFTNTVAYRRSSTSGKRVLLVDGWDEWFTRWAARGPNHAFVADHAIAMGDAYFSIESTTTTALTSGAVSLANYDAVFWIIGEESTTGETFSSLEQLFVSNYLDNGGQLFVSGAEVGWDLGRNVMSISAADRAFYANYLKAQFVQDDSQIYTAYGTASSIFDGINLSYDNGSAGIYYADWPDAIAPINGSQEALRYSPSLIAGITYEGPFTGGGPTGRLVYLGFGFETIHPAPSRAAVMERVLGFFDLLPPTRVEGSLAY